MAGPHAGRRPGRGRGQAALRERLQTLHHAPRPRRADGGAARSWPRSSSAAARSRRSGRTPCLGRAPDAGRAHPRPVDRPTRARPAGARSTCGPCAACRARPSGDAHAARRGRDRGATVTPRSAPRRATAAGTERGRARRRGVGGHGGRTAAAADAARRAGVIDLAEPRRRPAHPAVADLLELGASRGFVTTREVADRAPRRAAGDGAAAVVIGGRPAARRASRSSTTATCAPSDGPPRADTPAGVDAVRLYLNEIGRVDLLSPATRSTSPSASRPACRPSADPRLARAPRPRAAGPAASDRAARPSSQERADRGEPAPGRVDRQALRRPRPAVPRPDPGGQPRPDARGRQVRPDPRLQVLDLRDVVDPADDQPLHRRPVTDHPDPGPPGRDDEQDQEGRTPAGADARSRTHRRGGRAGLRARGRAGRGVPPARQSTRPRSTRPSGRTATPRWAS